MSTLLCTFEDHALLFQYLGAAYLVYEALDISAEVGDAHRLDPGLEEVGKLGGNRFCLGGK